ncbi:hypothetical protein [Dyella acidisoli]|nr:hypothetical protein [Dyella acidisoli]
MRASIKVLNLLLFIMLAAMASNICAAEKNECSNVIKFEPIATLPVNYLGWLATPISSSDADGGVVFWPFDEESYPTKGEWASIGIALGNTGDIGAQSIGGIIWVKKNVKSRVDYKAIDKSARVMFTIRDGQDGCNQAIVFEVDNNRNVNFGGLLVGKAKSIVE